MSSFTPTAPRALVHTSRPVRPVTEVRVPPARLTRRGRAVVLLVLVALVFSLASLGRVAATALTDGGTTEPVAQRWVVQPGETLWDVAVAVAPGTDPRDTVARIQQMNGLHGGGVVAGQTLLVPA